MINIWMYELKATGCCAAIRVILDSGPDGGNCPPGAGPCRGFIGNCGDVIAQFSDLPVLPDHPNGLADYVCTAFPDDARFIDTFLVSLLSIGAGLPVTLFIFTCFELANDGEAPDSANPYRAGRGRARSLSRSPPPLCRSPGVAPRLARSRMGPECAPQVALHPRRPAGLLCEVVHSFQAVGHLRRHL